MLFISRCAERNAYGVVDTDDGVEEFLDLDGVKKVIFDYGLEIAGVSAVTGGSRIRSHLEDILPYQREEYVSSAQTKLHMLMGVEITTYKHYITSIRWPDFRAAKPVSIRLSDFGSELGDRILYGNKDSQPHQVTLIFDDKITLSEMSLDTGGIRSHYYALGSCGIGVKLDIRELTRTDMIDLVYRSLFSDPFDWGSYEELSQFIIDDGLRKRGMIKYYMG